MEQLFFAGKAYLKINSLVKTPLHEFMAVERSGLWARGIHIYYIHTEKYSPKSCVVNFDTQMSSSQSEE